MSAPTVSTTLHKAAGIETAVAALSSSGALVAAEQLAGSHISGVETAVIAAVVSVLAFARRELPYVARLARDAAGAKVAAAKLVKEAKANRAVADEATRLLGTPAGKAAIAAAVAASKDVATVETEVKDVAADAAPVVAEVEAHAPAPVAEAVTETVAAVAALPGGLSGGL